MPLVVPGINSTSGNPTEQWMTLLMGKKLSDNAKSDETSFAKKELPSNHRVLGEDSAMTMDHQPDRLNVHVDKDGIVKKVTHG